MNKKPEATEPTTPAFTRPRPELPETSASGALRDAGHAFLAALQHFNAVLGAQSVGLTDDERRSGMGKLHTDEAPQLGIVARFAADNPAMVKGLAAKDGGVDPNTFESDVLLDHLAVHQTARDLLTAFDAEIADLRSLLGDLAIYRGALARPPLLAAYRLLSAHAEHDRSIRTAIRSVQEFYDRTPRAKGGSET